VPAYRELAAARIMDPIPGSDTEYRFTEDGLKRRDQILEREDSRERFAKDKMVNNHDRVSYIMTCIY
jgi:hypothetical protein